MKLGEFIDKFSHNNLIRLHHQADEGYSCIGDGFNDVSMDWEVNKAQGIFRHYVNNEVIKIIGIYIVSGSYPEAINIVVEKLECQPHVKESVENKGKQASENIY